jgi:chorismate mutase
MKDLEDLRKEIDRIDDQLVKLIADRMSVVREVGEYKKSRGIKPLDESRWQKVLERNRELATQLSVSEDLIVDIYNRMHESALKLESEV